MQPSEFRTEKTTSAISSSLFLQRHPFLQPPSKSFANTSPKLLTLTSCFSNLLVEVFSPRLAFSRLVFYDPSRHPIHRPRFFLQRKPKLITQISLFRPTAIMPKTSDIGGWSVSSGFISHFFYWRSIKDSRISIGFKMIYCEVIFGKRFIVIWNFP